MKVWLPFDGTMKRSEVRTGLARPPPLPHFVCSRLTALIATLTPARHSSPSRKVPNTVSPMRPVWAGGLGQCLFSKLPTIFAEGRPLR